jgi:hypothetical protein
MVASSTDATIEIRSSITVLPAIDIGRAAHAGELPVLSPVSTHAKTMYHTSSIALPGGVSKISTRTEGRA